MQKSNCKYGRTEQKFNRHQEPELLIDDVLGASGDEVDKYEAENLTQQNCSCSDIKSRGIVYGFFAASGAVAKRLAPQQGPGLRTNCFTH